MELSFLKQLNPSQRIAVEATDGPVLILAGAGSGKTRVLTIKVAYLILEKKIPAQNILMVTFTNKAAGEMKSRIIPLLGDDKGNLSSALSSNLPFAGTFHSFCAKLLRLEGKAIGFNPNFLIYDETDKKDAIKEILTGLNLDLKTNSPAVIGSMISGAKNELISAREYLNIAQGHFQQKVASIYLSYEKLLKENNALDFDDLIFTVIKLFQENKNISLN
ncbi:UvrD-helicase domain-containing protein [Candidatus Gottesmanbacteria bacterium]|nr:UvrD-helicase domain-containing protein [Candidatus Gottesmanbacteria bacterium]